MIPPVARAQTGRLQCPGLAPRYRWLRGARAALGLASLGLLALAIAACGREGATEFGGEPPAPQTAFASCTTFCHVDIVAGMIAAGGHGSLNVQCESCHRDLRPDDLGGPGHREVPVCASCHPEKVPHNDPEAGTERECFLCHNPHGSSNLFLIREGIVTSGQERRKAEVEFINRDGLADGSFASVSQPGTGLCEICHTQTEHYRNDGSGEPHLPLPCPTCHKHDSGFARP